MVESDELEEIEGVYKMGLSLMASRLARNPELEFDDEEEEKAKDDRIGDLTDPARTVVPFEAAESGREASDDRAGCAELLLIP